MRERLEGLAARLAANRMSAEEIQTLKAHIELHAEEFKRGNRLNEFDFDVNLHISILKSSNSPKLRQIVEQLISQIQRIMIMTPERIDEAIKEHRSILEALSQRDPDLAEASMVAHIRRSAAALRNYYQNIKESGNVLGGNFPVNL